MIARRQLECFASARLLVGMEGVGLTNAIAMARGATVVNLHPAHPASGFSTLRSQCGQVRIFASKHSEARGGPGQIAVTAF